MTINYRQEVIRRIDRLRANGNALLELIADPERCRDLPTLKAKYNQACNEWAETQPFLEAAKNSGGIPADIVNDLPDIDTIQINALASVARYIASLEKL